MTDNVLYIIGNGFDLHHGVMSNYRSFSIWLRRHHCGLYDRLQRSCKVDSLWSEFERALGHISRQEFLEQGELFLPDGWDPEEDQIADLLLAQDFARNSGEEFWDDIQKYFRQWVSTIKWFPIYDEKKIMLDTEARFITFNYTPFLESKYGIPSEQILYIHGKATDAKNPPVIGHDRIDHFEEDFNHLPKRLRSLYHGKKSDLPEIEWLTEGAETFDLESCKPVDKILMRHEDFFKDLYDIKYIYILGHSMGNVDMPYFRKIVECNDYPEKIEWYISYFGTKEQHALLNKVRSLSTYPNDALTPLTLQELQLKK